MSQVLFINKKANMTSFDMCYRLRKVFNTRTIGHTGTLDPMATGVMIILVEKACKANQFLSAAIKEYKAKVKIGYRTDTLDKDGQIVETKQEKKLIRDEVLKTVLSFKKKYVQTPPLTSAIKVSGKKLYEYQRRGIPVDIPKREVEIFDIELLAMGDDWFSFRCVVSSGTYVRSLAFDIAQAMGMIGTLEELKRTRIDNVRLEECDDFDEVLKGNFKEHTLYEVLANLYETIDYPNVADIKIGKKIRLNCKDDKVLLVNNGEVLAVYKRKEEDLFACARGLF